MTANIFYNVNIPRSSCLLTSPATNENYEVFLKTKYKIGKFE